MDTNIDPDPYTSDERFKLKSTKKTKYLVCTCGKLLYTFDSKDLDCDVCGRVYIEQFDGLFRATGYRCSKCQTLTDQIYPIEHSITKERMLLCIVCVSYILNELVDTQQYLGELIDELTRIKVVESI